MVSDYVFDEVWLVGFLWLYVLLAGYPLKAGHSMTSRT
jgi:hypothetical protein